MAKSRQPVVTSTKTGLIDAKKPDYLTLGAGQGLFAQKKEDSNVDPELDAKELPFLQDANEQPALGASEPKKNACGGSFATSPSCSDDPKNKSLIQKIICQGQVHPVDSICFGLLTAATVSAVVLHTDKWIKCGKPSKGALYAFGSLGLWGLEVARSINNIYEDEKKLV